MQSALSHAQLWLQSSGRTQPRRALSGRNVSRSYFTMMYQHGFLRVWLRPPHRIAGSLSEDVLSSKSISRRKGQMKSGSSGRLWLEMKQRM